MHAIGLTGGIGAGKSRVARCWSRYVPLLHLDADSVCRSLLPVGAEGWQALRRALDPGYFKSSGELDRQALRRDLFVQEELRRQVEVLLHPLVLQSIRQSLTQESGRLALVEVPLLFEAGWQQYFDRVVVIYAPAEVRRQRIVERDRVSMDEARRALAAQGPLEEKVLRADHVIDNGGCWARTVLQVLHLARLLRG